MDEIKLYELLGKQIKYLREQSNLTQEKMAEKCGLSLDYIGKIEVAINKPGLRALIKIAKALNVDIKDLFDF
ncbi:helix-turn-helix transcriptional regulator [bacterium]|nr:helix-turn-helix transcriptional regulator [bacterium]